MLSTETSSLSKCIGVVFAPNDRAAASINTLAKQLGFGHVVDYRHINDIPADRLIYILVHSQIPDDNKQRIIKALRVSTDNYRRYAPIVCMVSSGPHHQAAHLVQLGFDEVLFLADSVEAMAAKLKAQLQQEHIYVETGRYFGPDRRRIEIFNPQDPRRKLGPDDCRKISVRRDPQAGISASDVVV